MGWFNGRGSGWACVGCLAVAVSAGAQSATPIHIDASAPWQEPPAAAFDPGTVRSPSGETIGVNGRYMTLDGKPWLPVMGEFHFSRVPESQWEEEILKMKASGVNIVATYVFWIHHEEIEGQFDWSGQRDLRKFVQLCGKHGMYVLARIGPWAHGEVRNGGFPDWVLKQGPTRENDPVYLKSVRTWYGQIGQQLQGLLWKDGGPVIGIQLENEYAKRGPGAGEAHILELKKLAIASGFDVPLYLVTGWDNAAVPARAVMPVFGGYADAPWGDSLEKLPPSEVYAFRFDSRVTGNMGMMGAKEGQKAARSASVPFMTAEMGGGIEDTYHRRPVIEPDDTAAMFPVMIGSGVNLYGTYMYQGGQNPEGKLSTLQESQATGYPTDLPVKSYDFQAPLGEYGQERESLRKLKVFQYFVNSFGGELAPMMVHAPAEMPSGPADLTTPRAAVRSRGDEGFLFFNNYVRGYRMPARPGTQFEIALPGRTLQIPRRPVEIPSGAYFIWPFGLRVEGLTLRYSTAQLFTRLTDGEQTTLVFEAAPGIAPEFALEAVAAQEVHAADGKVEAEGGVTYVSGIRPGENAAFAVRRGGREIRFVVLSQKEAEDAWKVRLGGKDHLLITRQDFFADDSGGAERIWLRSRQGPRFGFTVMPPPDGMKGAAKLRRTAGSEMSDTFAAEVPARNLKVQITQEKPAGVAPPVKVGPKPTWRKHGVAEAPSDEAWKQAARWRLTVPADALEGLSNIFLSMKYQGDGARLYAGERLLDDDFFNGKMWQVGLKRYWTAGQPGAFRLEILPLRADAPIFLEPRMKPQIPAGGQVDKLEELRLVPEYQLTLTAGPGRTSEDRRRQD